tara:strand:+ start:1118 stop:1309 length:192 start_codon:yes stop_codon:yes gene_type:complete
MNVEINKQSIEQGRGFKASVKYFVDCDGYSFGSFDKLGHAIDKRKNVIAQLETKTAKEIYRGY